MSRLLEAPSWLEGNQRCLAAEFARLKALLGSGDVAEAEARLRGAREELVAPPAIDLLANLFGLSGFERDVVLLCAGVEMDAELAACCGRTRSQPSLPQATFGLALAALPEPHWSALTPASALRLWHLVEVAPGVSLTTAPLRIDERILHFLSGVHYLDERLRPFLRPLEAPELLTEGQRAIARRVVGAWEAATGGERLAPVHLFGPDPAGCRAVAAAACDALGVPLFALAPAEIPTAAAERDLLGRLCRRETMLTGSALLLDLTAVEGEPLRTALALVEAVGGLVVLVSRDGFAGGGLPGLPIEVPRPTPAEQVELWRETLGDWAPRLNGHLAATAEHFQLGGDAIRAASAEVVARLRSAAERPDLDRLLWDACRAQARPRLADLAQCLEPRATWDDLVLPPPQMEILRQIAANVGQRSTVYGRWGFAARGNRGLGITALFAGPSGTGKTLAAEVLAGGLRLDLYRIDLSQVVSKYIGETEKNLARVFDAAEEGGAVLLFDEADALFGRRSEVRDSHDRYANIEVSYLLQRMEAYRGLAILTTNTRGALDGAFLRRLRFIVTFPFPDAKLRARIWERIFPTETPTEGLDTGKLARLNVTGGHIRNIALNASFLAADRREPVRMAHLAESARAEYLKLEKPVTEAEIGGWG